MLFVCTITSVVLIRYVQNTIQIQLKRRPKWALFLTATFLHTHTHTAVTFFQYFSTLSTLFVWLVGWTFAVTVYFIVRRLEWSDDFFISDFPVDLDPLLLISNGYGSGTEKDTHFVSNGLLVM